MGSSFQTKVANGIDIKLWENDRMSGESEARSLAGRLPRGGEIDDGSIRRIEAPIQEGGQIEVWLDGDGFVNFEIPDDYEVKSVSSFDSPGACITITKAE
jgi:hypothetical protein